DVPVNVAGNAVGAVLGNAGAAAEESGAAVIEHDRHGDGREVETSGNGSLVGGNQAVLGLDVPVNVSGNAVGAVLGSAGAAAEDTGALVHHGDEHGGDGYDEGYDERSAQSSPVGGGLIDQLSEAARPLHLQTGGLDAGPVLHQSDERAHQSWSEGDTVESSGDRKSTRLNSSHVKISYAVFCLKKKKKQT